MDSDRGNDKGTEVRYPDVTVRLIGQDGNVFGVLGVVSQAIRRKYGQADADGWITEALAQESYEDVLRLVTSTVNVE